MGKRLAEFAASFDILDDLARHDRLIEGDKIIEVGPKVNAEGAEVLVPFVRAIVTSVSLVDGVVEIDPPDGLLDVDS